MGWNIDKRRQAIVDMLNQMGAIQLTKLKEYFPEVSEVTLRKDLQFLDERQQIIRVHGGAKALPHALSFVYRSGIYLEEKGLIAAKAAQLAQPGNSVCITAGSTCAELAKRQPAEPLYIFTDGLNTALSVPNRPEIKVEIFGGEVDMNIMRISGLSVLQSVEAMHFNIAFLGTPGFHPEHGFSYPSPMTAAVLSKAIENADKVVMLMDSSKVNYALMPRNIPMERIDVLVTDGKLEAKIVEKLKAKGVQVI